MTRKNPRIPKQVLIKQHDITDCAAACLASIAAWYKLTIPIARIRQYATTDQKGTNALGILEAANKLNFSAKGVRGDAESLRDIPCPAIAHIVVRDQLHHYVVIYGVTNEHVHVMDPGIGNMQRIPINQFSTVWTGILILLSPAPDFVAKNEKHSIAERFMYLLKPHSAILWQVLLGAIVYTILGLSTSIFLQKIVDNVLPNGNRNLLNLMGVAMLSILLIQLFINHTRTLLTIKTGQQIDARLILGYYKHLLRLPQSFFDRMRTGEIISRMNDAVKIRAFINDVLVNFAVSIFVLIFSFALMFTYYWKLALIMLLVVPFFAAVYYIANKVNRKTQRKVMEDAADLESQFVESINSVRTIKRFGLESFANFKTEIRFIQLLKSIYRSATNSLWIGNANSFIAQLFTIMLLWVGATFVLGNFITPGELLSFYAIIGYFVGPVGGLITMNRIIQDARIAADRLFEVMDLEQEETEHQHPLMPDMLGDISFSDIHFRYGTRVTVFEGLNMTIPHGKVTAIVGESGSGKTTILSLLQRIYPLDSGKISIGSHDIRYLTTDSLRKRIAVVPQEVHLFNGNIIENIAIGDMEPDMRRVLAICKEIGMLDFIERLPAGFETSIGENGTSLSGGQRQRLAIARALYRDPDLLILDEATSSLDSHAEGYIQQVIRNLQKNGKTVILIAHRLSTVVEAHQIIVLKNGQLVEQGNHSDLIASEGAYYAMWQQQFPIIKKLPSRKRTAPVNQN